MTEKQIKELSKFIHQKYGEKNHYAFDEESELTKEDRITLVELQIREMINSCLIYGSHLTEDGYDYQQYLKPYYEGHNWRNTGLITKNRLLQLIDEQKLDFAHAITSYAGIDSEGVSYNSCRWADEQ